MITLQKDKRMKCPKCGTDNPKKSKFCSDCGTDFPLPPTDKFSIFKSKSSKAVFFKPKRGTLFADRYEIIEELGEGGMGKVYRVEDKKVNEEIALKLIKPEIAVDKKTIGRFRDELKIARRPACRYC